ncbi:MAG: hypothetical protein LUG57_02430 [Oscillospiraceae bacterium]|nr:hypothetical protein [Oscillospiraceae bacterium]
MEDYEEQYEETLSIKELCLYILRGWRPLVIAVLVGAILLGGYQLVSGLTAGEELVMTEEEIATAESTIASNETTISNDQASLTAKQSELEGLQQTLADYQATLALAMTAESADAEMIVTILELNDSIASTQSQISSANQSINSLNNEISSLQSTNESLRASMTETTSTDVSLKKVVVYAVVGAVLGFLLVCVVAFCRWFFGGTLRGPEALTDRYALPMLGSVYYPYTEEQEKKRNKIDRLLDRLSGIEKPEPEKEYALAAAKLQVLGKEGRRLMVTGTLEKQQLETVCQALNKCFPADGPSAFAAENPMRDPDAMLQVGGCDILLVEGVRRSKSAEVDELFRFLRLSQASVVGTFMV